MSVLCKECGNKIPDGSRFCPYCGYKNEITPSPDTDKNEKEKLESEEKNQNKEPVLTDVESQCENNNTHFEWEIRKYISPLTRPKVHITADVDESRLQVTRPTFINSKIEIPYNKIAGMEIKTVTSLIWFTLTFILFEAVVCSLPLLFIGDKVLEGIIIFGASLFLIWSAAYQICHPALILTNLDGKQIELPAEKKDILIQVQSAIIQRTGNKEFELKKEKITSAIKKNDTYYIPQFEAISQNKRSKFNWIAFFFGPILCFYRSEGRLFRHFYLPRYVLIVSNGLLTSFLICTNTEGLTGGLTTIFFYGVSAFLTGIYSIVCAVRCGKNFNKQYYNYCMVQAGIQNSGKKTRECSWGRATLFFVISWLIYFMMGMIMVIGSFGKMGGMFGSSESQYEKDIEYNDYEDDLWDENANIQYNDSVEESQLVDEFSGQQLSDYAGKWYASNLDGSTVFTSEKYSDSYNAAFGLELVLLPVNDECYAYLYSNIHPFNYGFRNQSFQGDQLLPITQIDSSTWEIYFDEVDESSAYEKVIGTATLTLSVNALGNLFAEISDSSANNMERTKLIPASEWIGGQYLYYNMENSYLQEMDERFPMSEFDCELVLEEYLYGVWYDNTGTMAGRIYFNPGDIYLYSLRGEFYRNDSWYLDFSYKTDPSIRHTLRIAGETDLYLDDELYYESPPTVQYEIPEYDEYYGDSYLYPSDSQYITEYELSQFTKEGVSLIRNEIFARHGCTFKNADIRAYFESQSWYSPIEGLNAADFDTSLLNVYEKENVKIITDYEQKMGWR